MNFRRGVGREDPEINLIPLIDVLLVILIFLMVTTTYSKFSQLDINLPSASGEKKSEQPNKIDIGIAANGQLMIDSRAVVYQNRDQFAAELQRAAGERKDPIVIINADAKAEHQSVIHVMEAASVAGLSHVTFAIQESR
jgi:biopolymer transport protein ExbD